MADEKQLPCHLAPNRSAAADHALVELDAVADGGYYKIKDMEDCEAGGITPFVPKPDRSPARSSGHFTKSEFQYDAATDTYRCPAGQRLVPLYRGRAGKTHDVANALADRLQGLESVATLGRMESYARTALKPPPPRHLPVPADWPQQLRQVRADLALTQTQLAQRIGAAGKAVVYHVDIDDPMIRSAKASEAARVRLSPIDDRIGALGARGTGVRQ